MTALIDPAAIELTAEQEAFCRQAGGSWYPDLLADVTRYDKRLSEIDSELGLKSVGGKPKVGVAKRTALEAEAAHLRVQRATTVKAIAALAQQADAQIDALLASREEAAHGSEAVLEKISKASQKADTLMVDLYRALDERRKAIEELRTLMGDASVKLYLAKDAITGALGKAGLREFAFINGSGSMYEYRLQDSDAQTIASSVRNEVSRLSARRRERLDA